MNKFSLTKLACVVILSGCAQNNHPQLDQKIATESKNKSSSLTNAVKSNETLRLAAQDVDLPYISGNSIPLSREAGMPNSLKTIKVTANFQRYPVSLEKAVRQLSEASGINLTFTPDALLPESMFMPRGAIARAAADSGSASPALPLSPSISLALLNSANTTGIASPGPMVILRAGENGNSKILWQVLDDMARQTGLSWRVVENGAEFFRVETRIFHLPQNSSTIGTSFSLSRNGSSGAAFDTINKTTLSLKEQDFVKGMVVTVDALLTTGGKAVVSSESQSLIVTDTPAALERITRYIEDQHRNLTRRVRVVVDAYEVISKNNNDLGFNWNLVYSHLNRSFAVQSPAALAGSQSGVIGASIGRGAFSGTNLVVNALNEVASVVNQRSFPFTVTSGKPYTVAVRKTFDYVNQVQLPAQSTSSPVITTVNTPPSVMQKEETVGTFLTVIPTAKADGTIYLALYIDQTSSQPLKPFTVGGSESDGVTVQQKTIDGTGFILEAPTRSGVPIVMGAIETDTDSFTERRLAPGAPLIIGGANQRDTQKSRIVLVVTAISEEGV